MNRLAEIARATESLRQALPDLGDWLEPGRRLEGLDACHRRSRAWGAVAGEPPLVAALYGPTGAGKSTLFKLLSGIDVPSGEHMRPMSRSCALAVPPDWADPAKLGPVFPTAELVPLFDGSALAAPGQPHGRLHAAEAPGLAALGPGGNALLLVDAPDYNGVDVENALRAEEILLRAEILVFVLQVDSYLVAKNVEELARAARLATRLVILLTKTRDAFQAWTAWDDLCRRLEDAGGVGAPFATIRADGRACLEVVRSAPVFAWKRSEKPDLTEITARSGPSLVDRLAGYESRRIAWEGVAGAAHAAADDARRLVALARSARESAQARRALLVADARQAGTRVAGREFPFGAVLEALVAGSRSVLPGWWRIVTSPVGMLMSGIESLASTGARLMGSISDKAAAESPPSEPRDSVERRNLADEAEKLLDSWRARAELADLELDAAKCSRARAALLEAPLPGVSAEWKATLEREANRWVVENPALARALPVACDAMGVAGISLLVIDLGTTGGLFGTVVGTLSTGGLIAGAAGGLGFLGRWMGQWHLEEMLKRVDAAWRQQRAVDLSAHIERHLVGAVAGKFDAILSRAGENRLAAMEQAAAILDSAARHDPVGI